MKRVTEAWQPISEEVRLPAPELVLPADETTNPEYRRTHSSDGYSLGSSRYPNNRQGRRAIQRSWRGKGNR